MSLQRCLQLWGERLCRQIRLPNAINSATQCDVMQPPSAKLCCHPVQRTLPPSAITKGVQSLIHAACGDAVAVRSGRCPARAQGE
jgi:hypothetical protein